MSNATLVVVAGCNGSGKSSYSNAVTPDYVTPFDYDKHFLEFYNSIIDFELRPKMAHNKARNLLEVSVEKAILKKQDFCYETNFHATPMYWPDHFKKHGYRRMVFFFCLNSIEEAKRRVRIRVENGGHFIPDSEIENRYYAGYENLDRYFKSFEQVHLLNSSFYKKQPQHILSIINGKVGTVTHMPKFLDKVLPNISKLV